MGESALKAAGLGEEEEALYRLNKRTQAYVRASEALQQAAAALADDFAEAIEDLALREVARKFRDTCKSASSQQIVALNKEVAEPVRKACDGDNYSARQRLVGKAFSGLLDVNLECFRVTSALVEDVHKAAQAAIDEHTRPRARTEPVRTEPIPRRASVPQAQAPSPTNSNRRATVPNVKAEVSFDDLLGDVGGNTRPSKVPGSKGADLLDFDFDGKAPSPCHMGHKAAAPCNVAGPASTGTSVPPERAAAPCIPFDFSFDMGSSPPSNVQPPGVPASGGYAPASPAPAAGGGFSLNDIAWPSKEDEDESCIKARVTTWQAGKNIRTMLVSLHEVAPSSAGWVPVKLGDLLQASDVKSAYRKAVLAVHPDKHQSGKPGEKLLGHLVFEALREEWNKFQSER